MVCALPLCAVTRSRSRLSYAVHAALSLVHDNCAHVALGNGNRATKAQETKLPLSLLSPATGPISRRLRFARTGSTFIEVAFRTEDPRIPTGGGIPCRSLKNASLRAKTRAVSWTRHTCRACRIHSRSRSREHENRPVATDLETIAGNRATCRWLATSRRIRSDSRSVVQIIKKKRKTIGSIYLQIARALCLRDLRLTSRVMYNADVPHSRFLSLLFSLAHTFSHSLFLSFDLTTRSPYKYNVYLYIYISVQCLSTNLILNENIKIYTSELRLFIYLYDGWPDLAIYECGCHATSRDDRRYCVCITNKRRQRAAGKLTETVPFEWRVQGKTRSPSRSSRCPRNFVNNFSNRKCSKSKHERRTSVVPWSLTTYKVTKWLEVIFAKENRLVCRNNNSCYKYCHNLI